MAEDKSNDSGEPAKAVATSADLISAGVEYRASEATRHWLSGTLTALMLTCFAVSGWLWLQPLMQTQEAQAVSVDAVRFPRENAPTRVTRELVNIEDVQLGRRVVGRNPLREQTQLSSDIHPETHRTIRLEMIQYGTLYELAFVRSLTWLSEQQAQVGGMIQLVMTEMGLDGPARVISIEPCPEIEPDDGTGRMVVTGTMKHLAGNVLEIQTADDTEPLGVTDTHPFWSVDRQEFVVAGQLTVGEALEQADGTVTQVTCITPTRSPPVMVYNLEIDAEHVFHVGEDGLLVHNSCAEPEHHIVSMYDNLGRPDAKKAIEESREILKRADFQSIHDPRNLRRTKGHINKRHSIEYHQRVAEALKNGSSGILMASEIGFEVQFSAVEKDSQSIVCKATEATGVCLD